MTLSTLRSAALVCVVATWAACAPGPPEPKPGEFAITASPDLDRVSIHANSASRDRILRELRERHGVEVRTSEVPDATVTVAVDGVTIDAAVAALLPPGSRYALRLGDRDVAEAAAKEGKKVGATAERREGAPTKDETSPLGPAQREVVKARPELSLAEVAEREGKGLKPSYRRSVEVAEGGGAKKEAARPGAAASAVRLTFSITSAGQVRLIDTQEVEGELPPQTIVRGPLVYVVRDAAGQPVSFGALPDPLEEHSYKEDGTHSVGRAKEGVFGVWLPVDARQLRDAPAGITVEVLDARAATLPTVLDEKSLAELTRAAKPLGRFSGRDLVRSLRKERTR